MPSQYMYEWHCYCFHCFDLVLFVYRVMKCEGTSEYVCGMVMKNYIVTFSVKVRCQVVIKGGCRWQGRSTPRQHGNFLIISKCLVSQFAERC